MKNNVSNNMQVSFTTVSAFATFIAQLVREGVTFTAHETNDGTFVVELTGGY